MPTKRAAVRRILREVAERTPEQQLRWERGLAKVTREYACEARRAIAMALERIADDPNDIAPWLRLRHAAAPLVNAGGDGKMPITIRKRRRHRRTGSTIQWVQSGTCEKQMTYIAR
jgi:hypothetical protein